MYECHHLDEYLRTARIDESLPLSTGGGHSDKRRLILEGNVVAVAKPDLGGTSSAQIRSEVAACLLARELGWADLVPATVLRSAVELEPGGRVADCSVQVAWATFRTAFDIPKQAVDCVPSEAWRVAVFDVLIRNSDRKPDNWGQIGDSDVVRLFDHGNAHVPPPRGGFSSDFFECYKGQDIPEELLRALVGFTTQRDQRGTRLDEVLDPAAVDAVFHRAQRLVEDRTLAAPQE